MYSWLTAVVLALTHLNVTASLNLNSLFGFLPIRKRKKNLSFLFTPLLIAININESGLCDNEIPPSLLKSRRDLPTNVSVTVCSSFETNISWHPWRCTRCTAEVNLKEQKQWVAKDFCFNLENNHYETFWTNRAGMNQLHNEPKNMNDYPLNGLLSMKKVFSLSY